MLKFAHVALALSLLLPRLDAIAGGAPHGSFSHGFSSHAASSHAAAPHAAPAPRSPSGGFGAFGSRAAPAPAPSNSALSRQLSRNASQAKALQTLDERNAARAAPNPAQNAAQAGAHPLPAQPAGAPAAGPATVVVHQDSGIGHVVAGAMLAHSMNAHARGGYTAPPGPYANNASIGTGMAQGSHGSSVFSLLLTLCLLALIAWGIWFAWRGLRRRRAALDAANKPNYSFERN